MYHLLSESRRSDARRQQRTSGPHLRAACVNPILGSSAWPFSPRYRAAYRRQERLYAQAAAPESSKRSGTAESDRCSCTVWPSSSRKMGCIFVSLSFMRTEAFFTPPGRFACSAFGHSRPASTIAACRCERKERGIKK